MRTLALVAVALGGTGLVATASPASADHLALVTSHTCSLGPFASGVPLNLHGRAVTVRQLSDGRLQVTCQVNQIPKVTLESDPENGITDWERPERPTSSNPGVQCFYRDKTGTLRSGDLVRVTITPGGTLKATCVLDPEPTTFP